MKCYYHNDKELGKILIPHCWSSVIHGVPTNTKDACTCGDDLTKEQRIIARLENENFKLKQIIKEYEAKRI